MAYDYLSCSSYLHINIFVIIGVNYPVEGKEGGILNGGVLPCSPNPDLILDQKPYPIPTQNGQSLYPFSDQNSAKTLPFGAAHNYMGFIRESPRAFQRLDVFQTYDSFT